MYMIYIFIYFNITIQKHKEDRSALLAKSKLPSI